MNKKIVIGLSIVVLILFSISFSVWFFSKDHDSSQEKAKEKNETLRLTEISEVSTMDSVMSTDSASNNAIATVFEGLYRRDKNGTPIPAVAKEAPVLTNQGKTITFTLRKEAKWSNGEPVRAQDFVFAWRRVVDPKNASPNVSSMIGVVKNAETIFQNQGTKEDLGVKALNDSTLEVELEKPTPYFIELLCSTEFFPQNEEVVQTQGESYGTLSKDMVYNGPFMMKNWEPLKSEWTYQANDSYWDKQEVALSKVDVSVIKDTSTALNLYNTDKLDVVKVTGSYLDTVESSKELSTVPTSAVFYLMLNQQRPDKPTPLANEHIRKAIAYSLDKDVFCKEIMKKTAFPAEGFVPKGLAKNPVSGQDFRKENGNFLAYDNKQARAEWQQGMNELSVEEMNLEYVADDTDSAKKTAEFMKGQLEENLSGLTVTIKTVPAKVRMQLYQEKEYDIQLNGSMSSIADPIPLLELFESDNPNNLMGIKNGTYDELIKRSKGYGEDQVSDRWKTLLQAEKLLLDHAEVVPFYQTNRAILKKTAVKDLRTPLLGAEYDLKYTNLVAYIR